MNTLNNNEYKYVNALVETVHPRDKIVNIKI